MSRLADIDGILSEIAQPALLAFAQTQGKPSGPNGLSLSGADVAAAAQHFYTTGRLFTTEAVCRFGIERIGQDNTFFYLCLLFSAITNAKLRRWAVAYERLHRLVSLPFDPKVGVLGLIGQLCKSWSPQENLEFLNAYGKAATQSGAWRHMLEAAAGLYHNEDRDGAIKLIEAAIVPAAGRPEPLFSMARALSRSGYVEESISIYQKLLTEHPDHWLGHYDIVRLLRLVGRYTEADVYEQRQQTLPRSDGDALGFHEMGQSGLVDMNDVAALAGKNKLVREYWHRTDDIRFFPSSFDSSRLTDLIQKHFLDEGRSLPNPIFARDARLVTFGSCFATYLRGYLAARKKTSETIQVAEELNNTWALRSYLDWCFTGNASHTSYWFETAEDRYSPPRPYEDYRRMLLEADGFVLTLGLSEIWRDRETGGVFWKGIPDSMFRDGRHEIVLSTPEENLANIRHICNLFRHHCGNKPIIFTVSPVPLKATFRGIPCMEADCASKSILRSAVEMLMLDKPEGIYYWPSYEIVRWLGAHLDRSPYGSGAMGGNGTRHVQHDVVDAIVTTFIRTFFAA